MSKRLNVASVYYPEDRPTEQEWLSEFRVSSGYVKPTPYFGGNEFNTQIFLRTEDAGRNVSWQDYLLVPFKTILNYGQQLW
jgi:hypothetical protein